VRFVEQQYLTQTSPILGRSGEVVQNSERIVGIYFWSTSWRDGKMYLSQQASKPVVVHEMVHYLQDANGISPGSLSGAGLERRRAIEAQAYDAERRAPFECMTVFGGWKIELSAASER